MTTATSPTQDHLQSGSAPPENAGPSADLVTGRDVDPLQAFATDFTELLYAQGRAKAWLMALLDIPSRWGVGFGVGPSRNRGLALSCLDRLCTTLAERGRTLQGVILHHDRDSVDCQSRLAFQRPLRRTGPSLVCRTRGPR